MERDCDYPMCDFDWRSMERRRRLADAPDVAWFCDVGSMNAPHVHWVLPAAEASGVAETVDEALVAAARAAKLAKVPARIARECADRLELLGEPVEPPMVVV
jgi:hypothetical protein